MSVRVNRVELLHRDEVVAPPAIAERACQDHNFELPGGVYAAMVLFFAGAIAILASAFRGNMVVSYAIIFAFLTAFFGVPLLFVRASRDNGAKALSWARFNQRGIATATGPTSAGEAVVLVLMLPFLIFCFAGAVVTIAALVG
jgi:hypothetical protein